MLKKLNSKYIVRYLGFDEDTDHLYIIMQFYEVFKLLANKLYLFELN
jgi:hypothetical protein